MRFRKLRIRSTIFFLILLLALLSSCSTKKAEKGKISKAQVDKNVAAATSISETTKFKEKKVPFGYSVKTVTNGMAYQAFKIPSSFKCSIPNARHIIIDAPGDDIYVSGATFHLLYNYTSYGMLTNDPGDGDDSSSEEDTADNYADLFKSELPYLTYYVDEKKYMIGHYDLSDEMVIGSDFSKKRDVASMVCNDVDLWTSGYGNMGPEGKSEVIYFFKWQGIPCSLSTIVDKSQVKNAKKVMEYMISSSKLKGTRFDTRKTYKLKNATVSLPEGFESDEDYANVLNYPYENTKTAMSGISIGEFYIDTKKSEKLTLSSMDDSATYSTALAKNLFVGESGYSFSPSTRKNDDLPKTMGGKKATGYTTFFTLDTPNNGSSGDNIRAGSFYGDPTTCCMDTLVIQDGNTQKILSIFYQPVQEKVAQNILLMASKSISFD